MSACFLALPSVEIAISRAATRVQQGGHHIPDELVRRRFIAGKRNFEAHYRAAVDTWSLYDNSGNTPEMLEWGEAP